MAEERLIWCKALGRLKRADQAELTGDESFCWSSAVDVVGHARLLQEGQRLPDVLLAHVGEVIDACAGDGLVRGLSGCEGPDIE